LVRSCRGFTLLELMIVVAIVGILAAVSVPLYISYIQKSRIKTYVYPGLHVIQTGVAFHYATASTMPDASRLSEIMISANTTYFHLGLSVNELVLTIDSPASTSKLSKLDGMKMYLRPETQGLRINGWLLRGPLADYLGINTE